MTTPTPNTPRPENRLDVWSCGGGTQSVAIAGLIYTGRLPKPDHSFIIDTGREKSSTWEYVNGVLIPKLAEVGVDLKIIHKDDYKTPDLYWDAKNTGEITLLLPVFTNQSGEIGKVGNFCSGKWKRDTAHRYLRSIGVEKCRTWIGISTNELSRVSVSRLAWNQNYYPLIEAESAIYWNRNDCIHFVTEVLGWPKPPRSACWMCANMSDDEWRELKANYPGDFAKACDLDDAIRSEHDPNFFIHGSCVPLREVDFSKPTTTQLSMFGQKGGCSSGYCFN